LSKSAIKGTVGHNHLLRTLKKRIQRLENDIDDKKKDDELSLSQNAIADVKSRKIDNIGKAACSAKAQKKGVPAGEEESCIIQNSVSINTK
jgi:hypothetical protein